MTEKEQQMLTEIHNYANEVLADIDPQNTPVSYQLEKLRPIMEEIASRTQRSVEDILIQYLDLASEAAIETENKWQDTLRKSGENL